MPLTLLMHASSTVLAYEGRVNSTSSSEHVALVADVFKLQTLTPRGLTQTGASVRLTWQVFSADVTRIEISPFPVGYPFLSKRDGVDASPTLVHAIMSGLDHSVPNLPLGGLDSHQFISSIRDTHNAVPWVICKNQTFRLLYWIHEESEPRVLELEVKVPTLHFGGTEGFKGDNDGFNDVVSEFTTVESYCNLESASSIENEWLPLSQYSSKTQRLKRRNRR